MSVIQDSVESVVITNIGDTFARFYDLSEENVAKIVKLMKVDPETQDQAGEVFNSVCEVLWKDIAGGRYQTISSKTVTASVYEELGRTSEIKHMLG